MAGFCLAFSTVSSKECKVLTDRLSVGSIHFSYISYVRTYLHIICTYVGLYLPRDLLRRLQIGDV